MAFSTATDLAGTHAWRINDEVTQLREWATTNTYPLPPPLPKGERRTIGASSTCWLRLQDRRVSRRHAELTYQPPNGWTLTDLQSKNGVLLDGVRRGAFPLTPGVEVRIGRVTLIAESPLFCALRNIVSRLIGWSSARRPDVDTALRAIRMAATLHEPLLLCADAGHMSIARLLHQYVLGADRPFVICERRKSASERAARSEPGLTALSAATGGTLVVWRNRLPEDFDQVIMALREPTAGVLLVVCSQTQPHGADTSAQMVVPPLAGRPLELTRIIDEYAADAIAELGGSLTSDDRRWVAAQELTHSNIQTATRRLAALRAAGGSVKRAAERLGMSHGSLSVWLARRDLPTLRGVRDEGLDVDDE
ncbi:MAG TPA: FHA domain-containing protein [Kofleriaceae bacterium]|nr:FHA domain-containing protein [Kofleriaceae bacterium]